MALSPLNRQPRWTFCSRPLELQNGSERQGDRLYTEVVSKRLIRFKKDSRSGVLVVNNKKSNKFPIRRRTVWPQPTFVHKGERRQRQEITIVL